jgi:hypothetical protein
MIIYADYESPFVEQRAISTPTGLGWKKPPAFEECFSAGVVREPTLDLVNFLNFF